LQKGLQWHEEGHSGDGLNPDTVGWATRMVNGSDISPDKAIKMRAWLARHETDKEGEGFYPGQRGFPSPGRVAWALWGGDPAKSWSNKLVNQMKAEDEKSKKSSIDKRAKIWFRYIEKQQGPAENKMDRAMRQYFRLAKKRYIRRIKKAERRYKNNEVLKSIDYRSLVDLIRERTILKKFLKGTPARLSESGRILRGSPGAWQGVWEKSGMESLKRLFKLADKKPPTNIIFGEQSYADELLDKTVDEITKTTAERIRKKVAKGLNEGLSLDDIALDLDETARDEDPIFGFARAKTIARTESTRIISGAQNRSFDKAEREYGLVVKKIWVANRDARTRDLHLDLESKYGDESQAIPQNYEFEINGFKAQGPGLFGDPSMDVNCRCAVIPVVE
tara:strand:- start:1955 stop:3127 length:1173 start_codon:yes stop_codon:yes gene_type:complete